MDAYAADLRRLGYLIAAAINAALIYLINVKPGWQAVPFLTAETDEVLGLVDLVLLAGVAVNLVYIWFSPPWLRALGDLITTAFGLALLIRIWQVFPFDFSDMSVNWTPIARFVLVMAVVGSVIGLVVHFGVLVKVLLDPAGHRARRV